MIEVMWATPLYEFLRQCNASRLGKVVLLPEAGTFEAFAQELEAGQLDAILGDMRPLPVRLAMPRFRI